MKWIIEGAGATSGADVRVNIEAVTAELAGRIANANGIFVSAIKPASVTVARPAAPVLPYQSQPGYKLFQTKAVALATFLGSPLAGATVLAMNFHRLGRDSAAVTTVILGAVGTVLIALIAMSLPHGVPGPVFWVPALLIMQQAANRLQGEAVERHIRQGGQLASGWLAAGIALLTVAGLAVLLVGAVMLIG